jgi:pilus assembly protein Flp/PilA
MDTRLIEAIWSSSGDTLRRFAADTRGATAIEYAIIAAGVGAAIAATVYNLGTTVQTTLYNKIDGAIK